GVRTLVDSATGQVLQPRKDRTGLAERVFRPHLETTDVMFVDWCGALAALISQVDPGQTRIVVRMHSFEVFTKWPQLVDFTRVDDLVFVSSRLRDLAVAAVPALQRSDSPRLHVI